ncbi:MAG: hypothetical protein WCQ00_03205 [bacterium]
MLILELMTSLMLWIAIMIPINSYILGINERSPYKLIQDVSNQTIFDVTKVGSEAYMNRVDLCSGDTGTSTPSSYMMISQIIPVKSTSTEVTGIISDGQNIYVSLNSASTTDYDLITYNYKNISEPLDRIDSGPGVLGLVNVGRNILVINSSVNSAIQKFKFDPTLMKLNKVGDYKISWSSSANPVYATKLAIIYPHLFVGLKKNNNEELFSIDLTKIDSVIGMAGAIDNKWELDSSVQDLWPMYDKYQHLLVSTAKEPEIIDLCLNCNFTYTPMTLFPFAPSVSSFDLFGSLGNVRSLIQDNGSIYVGRTAGNNELFKINIDRDYSTSTKNLNQNTAVSFVYDLVNSIDVNEGIYSMLISGRNLFIAAGKNNSKIQIRDSFDLSKIIQTINTTSSIIDLECVGDKIFGVGSNYKMNGTSTESITPIIFELIPA